LISNLESIAIIIYASFRVKGFFYLIHANLLTFLSPCGMGFRNSIFFILLWAALAYRFSRLRIIGLFYIAIISLR
jgi:hypothetical protein